VRTGHHSYNNYGTLDQEIANQRVIILNRYLSAAAFWSVVGCELDTCAMEDATIKLHERLQ